MQECAIVNGPCTLRLNSQRLLMGEFVKAGKEMMCGQPTSLFRITKR
jgi:hypothetical protein